MPSKSIRDIKQATAQALLDHCPLALLLVDSSGQISGCNRAFSALLGDTAAILEGDARAIGVIAPLLNGANPVSWIMPDGDERQLRIDTVEIEDTPAITAYFYHDITETLRFRQGRDQLQAEIAKLSLHDEELPGLLSRLGLQVSLEPLVSRSRRYENPLTLLGIGIDSNEDRAATIKKVSFLLKDQTRWADLVGCNQTRDFILILQETNQDAAVQLLDKLVVKLAVMGIGAGGESRVSFGVTQCQRNDDANSMLERAESAIAEARKNDSGIAITS